MSELARKVRQPKTKRGKKFLENRAPKINENDKKTLIFKGGHTSQIVNDFLHSMCALKTPLIQKLKFKNPVLPFEDASFIEHMCRKYDCSLFITGMHSKKRPNNIVVGRIFNGEVMDMFELGINKFVGFNMKDSDARLPVGCKPMLVFSGETFTDDTEMIDLKSILVDLFRGPKISAVNTYGIEEQIHFVATSASEIKMRVRAIDLQPASTTEENIIQKPDGSFWKLKLTDVGPIVDFAVRRFRLPTDETWKKATHIPKQLFNAMRKPKNITQDEFGTKLATVHLARDDKSMEELRPGKSMRTALTGKRKRGFERHSTMKQQHQDTDSMAKKAKVAL